MSSVSPQDPRLRVSESPWIPRRSRRPNQAAPIWIRADSTLKTGLHPVKIRPQPLLLVLHTVDEGDIWGESPPLDLKFVSVGVPAPGLGWLEVFHEEHKSAPGLRLILVSQCQPGVLANDG